MSHIHVCLVSDQTIPNILGIYHFNPDRVVFCSTKKMEERGKTDAIINTLKLYGRDYSQKHDEPIIVDQDCLEDCEMRFRNEMAEKYANESLTVNLTGGTKIMVIGAYNVFHDIAKQMIYTPIPKNEYVVVHPKSVDCSTPSLLQLRLSVEAYVTAYGVRVRNSGKLAILKANAARNKELCRWMVENYCSIEETLSELFRQLKGHRGDNNFRLKMNYTPKNPQQYDFLQKLEMQAGVVDKTLQKHEIKFLTGDWLSDYCYNEIATMSVDDCATGIELVSTKGADNEFDVMFTKDNALYIVECKSLRQEHDKDADILYKISALQHDFGLRVDGFLVSTAKTIMHDDGGIRESILRRSKQCNTQVIHPNEISGFRNWIGSRIKGLSQ